MRPWKYISILFCMLLSGCHREEPVYTGSSNSRTIDGQLVNFVLQFDHYKETDYEGKVDPLFLILWKGSNATVTLNFDKPSIIINGHVVKASFDEQSVYLLRRDYSLERVDTDRRKVFELFIALPKTNIPTVWTEKILPKLETIP